MSERIGQYHSEIRTTTSQTGGPERQPWEESKWATSIRAGWFHIVSYLMWIGDKPEFQQVWLDYTAWVSWMCHEGYKALDEEVRIKTRELIGMPDELWDYTLPVINAGEPTQPDRYGLSRWLPDRSEAKNSKSSMNFLLFVARVRGWPPR